jgi:hypothetical protein
VLLLIVLNATFMVGGFTTELLIPYIFDPYIGLGRLTTWQYMATICSPSLLLLWAEVIVCFQLCRIRWQRRSETVAWELTGQSLPTFCCTWVGLTLIVIVGVPTLSAFAFLFWLSPINYTGW